MEALFDLTTDIYVSFFICGSLNTVLFTFPFHFPKVMKVLVGTTSALNEVIGKISICFPKIRF